MSRESDWHVFDKACDITAMAVRGTAGWAEPAAAAAIFYEIHRVLKETADALEASATKAGF
jgi:hypothetical protein